eukprot:CAMPEP_0202431836 /NCGR_PEP_ID=MMETSP1345-20130828/6908_1 /ASSEMBLY_ACC=CAM_ASM_000843 /TAXON_ID=342563 /ORGANISM="Fabrea Fabrea salina" /LENGTH=40 /DNA_ID= /DNA_START= /DNA_END= /DNA_ORIENTATION=
MNICESDSPSCNSFYQSFFNSPPACDELSSDFVLVLVGVE